MPETVIPGASNPKIDQSVQIIEERLSSRSRTILWCDSPEMAEHTVKSLCTRFPGKFHAVGFSDRIEVWKNGKLVETFRKKVYTTEEREFPASEWKVYVLKYVIQPNRKVLTLTLTDSYSVGQNLQAFDTVIHLDRDSWNSELMKQRTARAWRSGQKNSVHEYTLDTVFTEVDDPRDETVDRIMAAMQQLEGELFDQVVIESQAEALGKEFFSMQRTDASFFQLDRRMMELAMSPYAKKIGLSEAS
jgi:hypothetical protein